MLSSGYLVAVLAMIRVGENILQRIGARSPMIWGTTITEVGIGLMALTFLPDSIYTIVVFVCFALSGLGLGMYATPSTDTAVMSAPGNKIGEASGIYKMTSSLGGAFRNAISTTVYRAIYATGNVELAGTIGLITKRRLCYYCNRFDLILVTVKTMMLTF